jgi:pimeloyl-ACP methyl ester carboxylesterase
MTDFLLLHGLGVDAREWQRVVPLLQAGADTGKVVAPNMPGRGPHRPRRLGAIRMADYIATAVAALRENDMRDVVVVGHSGGGAYLQAVVAEEPERVRHMVFLCSAIPENGHSLLELQTRTVRVLVRLLLFLLLANRRGIVPARRLAKRTLCNDLEPEGCAMILKTLVPEPPALLRDRIGWDAERVRVAATYIHTTRDRIIRPAEQLRMAKNAPNPKIVTMDTGHAYPLVHPERLVEILLGIA